MKRPLLIIALIYLFIHSNNAQQANTLWGFQTGNNLSLPNSRISSRLQEDFLLRYSVGLMVRRVLKRNIRGRFIAPLTKGIISADFGVNMVFKGYQYQFGSISSFTEQWSFEIPILLHLYDTRNIFLTRKMHRKGIATFVRLGFKLAISPQESINKEFSNFEERVVEEVSIRSLNVLWNSGVGILRNYKNGHQISFEFNANLGFLRQTSGILRYEDNDKLVFQDEPFWDKGSYLSINMIYLFDLSNTRLIQRMGKKPPIIYNPRYGML